MAKIKFPVDFWHFDGSHVRPELLHTDKDIQKSIDRIKKKFKDPAYKDDTWFFEGSGDYLVIGVKSDNGERRIWVTKDYWEIEYCPGNGWLKESEESE